MANTSDKPILKDGEYIVKEVNELNFFDLTGEKAKTAGSSNKMYHAELHIGKAGGKAQIFTMYGPTGNVQRKEYRCFSDEATAKKEYDKILKSKRNKGYKDIDVAQRALGSDEAKQITKAVQLKNLDAANMTKSTLHVECQRLVSGLMKSTNNFVIQLLKCPLGQLSNKQIEDGRARLEDARKAVKQKDSSRILELTNEFYGLIPHNLGSGARGQLTQLLLDSEAKILQKDADLDILLDAKAIGATLVSDDIDQKYRSLNTELDYIPPKSGLFNWIDTLVQKTRATNHSHLGKITVKHAWRMSRNNEFDGFIKSAKQIAKENVKHILPDVLRGIVDKREDISDVDLYYKTNILPLFHGTRTQNIVGIMKQGLLIRPSNAVLTGSMYGNAIYKGFSSKSINYTSIRSSYWAGGTDDSAYLFIDDCILGNSLIAKGPYQYTSNNIKPSHSVWAKGGLSGVINDEFMLYKSDQHTIRYIVEFTCSGR